MRAFLRGFAYAGRGLAVAARGRNFRVMLAAAAVTAALAWWLDVPPQEAAVLALAMGLVLALEAFNTAGELLLDVLHPEHDPRIGRVKDVLAGGVLAAAVATAVAGLLVLGPPLWERLFG